MKMPVLTTMRPRYIVDGKGKKVEVVLDVRTFKIIVEELEDFYDIRRAEKILAKGEKEEGRTIDELERKLHKKKRRKSVL